MLIRALCDYYDVLAEQGKVLPEGYSNVGIHYLIALNPDGRIFRETCSQICSTQSSSSE